MSSSTSSSDRRPGIPWGALWCVLFVLLAEIVCRQLPASFFLTMDQHDYRDDDTLDYAAVDLAIELLPAPDIVVIGTSRARESVQSATLAMHVSSSLGCDLPTIRNYGTAGGRIDISVSLVDRMISEHKLPRVVVVALDASDFRDTEPNPDRFRYADLFTLGDEIDRNGLPSEAEMTAIIGNSIPLQLARARPTLRHRLVGRGRWGGTWVMENNSAYGGMTGWSRADLRRETQGRPTEMKVTKGRIARVAKAYAIDEDRLTRLGELIERLRSLGVAVAVVEIPASPPVREQSSVVAAQHRLRAEIARLVEPPCVTGWTAPGFEDDFGLREFRDPSHLSARGSAHYTRLIAPVVAAALDSTGICAR